MMSIIQSADPRTTSPGSLARRKKLSLGEREHWGRHIPNLFTEIVDR